MNQSNDSRDLRVDQVGSLIRPNWFLEVLDDHEAGRIDADELPRAQDRAIADVIAAQEAIRFPILTDGEFRRNLSDSFLTSIDGLEPTEVVPGGPIATAVGPLSLRRNLALGEWTSANAVAKSPVKIPILSPVQTGRRISVEATSGYADQVGVVDALAAIQGQLIGELVRAGCPYVQVDATVYTRYVDESPDHGPRPAPGDLARDLQAENRAIAERGVAVVGIHLCRGNFPTGSPFLRRGGYDAIAEEMFSTLEHDRFLLEYDDERSGSFEPLRFVPQSKTVVLGMVSTRSPELESPDVLKARIEDASRYISLDQLAISPQCGFATFARASQMSEDVQWRKLELLMEVAESVWGTAAPHATA